MERNGRPRRRPEAPSAPTTLTEITRRYYATAVALAKAMGLPLTETFLREHRESISCCFIEAGRAGVRLPPAVQLQPLAPGDHGVDMAVTSPNGQPVTALPVTNVTPEGIQPAPTAGVPEVSVTNVIPAADLPTRIPAGLPCANQAITALKPAQLRMLLSKVDQLAAEHGSAWRPLLEAIATERAARLQAGQRPKLVTVEENGYAP